MSKESLLTTTQVWKSDSSHQIDNLIRIANLKGQLGDDADSGGQPLLGALLEHDGEDHLGGLLDGRVLRHLPQVLRLATLQQVGGADEDDLGLYVVKCTS